MVQFSVLRADNSQDVLEWTATWKRWPAKEVFAHPNYLRLFESEGEKAYCALFKSDEGTVIYPFFLRKIEPAVSSDAIDGEIYDIASPYGYGGAVVVETGNGATLAEEFWTYFDAWCRQVHVVSEFARFSLFPESLLDFPGEVEERQENVIRSLGASAEDLWMDFDHKVRKNVKKALRSGVTVEIDYDGSRFRDFYRIYLQTMDRRAASANYYFQERFFHELHRSLTDQFVYFHAYHEGEVVSTELVLISEQSVYSFLGGTLESAFDKRPNDLLKFEAITWATEQGKKNFVLGGGYAPRDGIFRHKRAFAPHGCVPFRIGRRILNHRIYDALVRAKVPGKWRDVPGDYFPAYRA